MGQLPEMQSNVRPRIALLTLATPGGGLIRRAALYVGDTRLGATGAEPYTYRRCLVLQPSRSQVSGPQHWDRVHRTVQPLHTLVTNRSPRGLYLAQGT